MPSGVFDCEYVCASSISARGIIGLEIVYIRAGGGGGDEERVPYFRCSSLMIDGGLVRDKLR